MKMSEMSNKKRPWSQNVRENVSVTALSLVELAYNTAPREIEISTYENSVCIFLDWASLLK